MSEIYYKEKLLKLVEKLFTHQGDAKSKFIELEELIFATYLSTKIGDMDKTRIDKWDAIWHELNSKPELSGNKVFSSFSMTIRSKRNKSLIKYLDFFLEEFYRVI